MVDENRGGDVSIILRRDAWRSYSRKLPAKCPHCHGGRADAGDCDECRGTGRLLA